MIFELLFNFKFSSLIFMSKVCLSIYWEEGCFYFNIKFYPLPLPHFSKKIFLILYGLPFDSLWPPTHSMIFNSCV